MEPVLGLSVSDVQALTSTWCQLELNPSSSPADKDTQHEVRANAAVERSRGTLAGDHSDDSSLKGVRLLQAAPSIINVSNRKQSVLCILGRTWNPASRLASSTAIGTQGPATMIRHTTQKNRETTSSLHKEARTRMRMRTKTERGRGPGRRRRQH